MPSEERQLRDAIKCGDFCPYCRSRNTTNASVIYDWRCEDCRFAWDSDGVDAPPDKKVPRHV